MNNLVREPHPEGHRTAMDEILVQNVQVVQLGISLAFGWDKRIDAGTRRFHQKFFCGSHGSHLISGTKSAFICKNTAKRSSAELPGAATIERFLVVQNVQKWPFRIHA